MEISSGSFSDESQYVPKTDAEIKDIAMGIHKNSIFISWQIAECDSGLLSSIFMPLVFLDDVTRKEMMRDGVDTLYANMSDAVGGSINGYPIFFAFGMLNANDAVRVSEKLKQIREVLSSI